MISAIIEIVLGYVIWHFVPDWIQTSNTKVQELIRLCANIIGVIMVLLGIVALIKSIIAII